MTNLPMSRTPGFWFAAAATAVVVAAVVAGVLAVGGPGEARLEKLDEARRADLQAIERELRDHWRRGEPTPPALGAGLFGLSPDFNTTLSRSGSAFDPLHDPGTGEPYPYRALSDTSAELCAVFARAHSRRPSLDGSAIDQHPAGRACFVLTPHPDF